MTSEFPLLSAVLEQSLGPLPPAHDIGRVLGALGIAGASYHSFEPPRPPEAQSPEPAALPRTVAGDLVGEVPPTQAQPIRPEPVAADLPRLEPELQDLAREAPVWTTPTLGMPTRTEMPVMAQAAPASFVQAPPAPAMAEQVQDHPARSRYPAEPEQAATRPAGQVQPDHVTATRSQSPIRQPLSLSGLFRILGSPTPTQAAPSRTLRDVFGYGNKRNS